jgi:transcriptional regulator with XRE-family HTH domain
MTGMLRQELGDVLRDARRHQGRTLREVSTQARVSLGYLSEVERGQKEASSELLSSICTALHVPLSSVLREVSDRLALAEAAEALLRGEPATDLSPSEESRPQREPLPVG